MTPAHDYGPVQTFEVIWRTGHIEQIPGHQVITESGRYPPPLHPRLMIHGMFGEHWRLMLIAPEEDILQIRNVTDVTDTIQPRPAQ